MFGSRTNGTAKPYSDVDLAVISDNSLDKNKLWELREDLSMKKISFVLTIFAVLMFFGGCAPKIQNSNFEDCNFQNSYTDNFTEEKKEVIKKYTIGEKHTSFVGSQIVKTDNFNIKITTETVFLINSFEATSDCTIEIPQELSHMQAKKNNQSEKIFIKKGDIFPINCFDTRYGYYTAYRLNKCSFDASLSCQYLFHTMQNGDIDYIEINGKKFIYKNSELLRFFKKVDKVKQQNKIIMPGSFSHELIYSGKDGNNIKVSYREYKDDMARPAFFQDLTYNLKESDIIRYKNYKIKVHKATNEEISYTVLED